MKRERRSAGERPRRTRLALLGTLGRLHEERLHYDVARLRELVEALEPDLLGVEVEPDVWEAGDPELLPREIRAALVPATRLTDTVIVPLGAQTRMAPADEGSLVHLRARLIDAADDLLSGVARLVDDPAGVSRGAYLHVCAAVCQVEAAAAGATGREAWARANDEIVDRLLDAAARNPGSRILVAVQCRRVHAIVARLRGRADDIELVRFEDLAAEGRMSVISE